MKGGMVDYYKIQDEYRAEWVDYVYNMLKAKECLYKATKNVENTREDDYGAGWECGNLESMIINISFLIERYKKNG